MLKGKLGEMSQDINPSISIDIKDDLISVFQGTMILKENRVYAWSCTDL